MDDASPKPVQKKRERSTAYPACSLETSLNDIMNLKERLGKGPYSREEAAKALGYSGINGISAGRIAACVHYGLLARSGSTYGISDLANRIINPTSEDEKGLAITEAFQAPALYSKLVKTYMGSALPTMLPNILARNYGIADKAASNAAQTFRDSAEYAGMLKSGVIVQPEFAKVEHTNADTSNTANGTNAKLAATTSNSFLDEPHDRSQFKERGVNEAGDGWELKITLRYDCLLPRSIRKKVTELFDEADDIVDELNKISNHSHNQEGNDEQ